MHVLSGIRTRDHSNQAATGTGLIVDIWFLNKSLEPTYVSRSAKHAIF
jgi:hypothetical protein